MPFKQLHRSLIALGLMGCTAEVTSSGDGNGAAAAQGGLPAGAGTSSLGSGGSRGLAGSGLGAAGSLPNAGGSGLAGTTGIGGSFVGGGAGGTAPLPALDCGANGVAIENAGPAANRVNYVILGDGYDATSVGTTFISHVNQTLEKRFSEQIGQPYGRYRKFVNICALKTVSATNGIGNGETAFGCTGDDQSRLARCDTRAADDELDQQLPASFEVTWHAIVLNNDRWWNTGSRWMLWSGGHESAAGAALHEGGHGFHDLADEYLGTSGSCGEFDEVNSTADQAMTEGKWDLWLNYNALGATGMQGAFQGSRYCSAAAGQYRPSGNSMMNSLFGDDPDTSFNQVSREKIVMDIWRHVRPVDSSEPPAGAVSNPTTLQVNVIDPAVISVDWSVDGELVAKNGGAVYNIAASQLPVGSHTVTAKAYDNAGEELVRYRTGKCSGEPCWARDSWANSDETVTWTVSVP